MPCALGLVSLLIFRFIVIIVELSGHSWQRLLSFANTGKQVSKKVNITEFQKNWKRKYFSLQPAEKECGGAWSSLCSRLRGFTVVSIIIIINWNWKIGDKHLNRFTFFLGFPHKVPHGSAAHFVLPPLQCVFLSQRAIYLFLFCPLSRKPSPLPHIECTLQLASMSFKNTLCLTAKVYILSLFL